jgi:uncharacterized protein (DUF433 family)
MSPEAELLTTPEAAAVAGVSVRDVNRLIDEHILPEPLYILDGNRRVYASACALVRFYVCTAESLTANERGHAIRDLWGEARHDVRTITSWRRQKRNWAVHHHYLTINFDKFIDDTIEEHAKLTKAREIVVEDPGILGGTPVVKGSRVPVYDIAASAASGLSVSEIQEDYPSLDESAIELAILYAKATPQRGRPKEPTKARRGPTTTRKVFKRRPA